MSDPRSKNHPIGPLLIATAVAGGTDAYADVVYFENPAAGEEGHFDWHMSEDLSDPGAWLDVTKPSTDQAGTRPQALPSSTTGSTPETWQRETCIWGRGSFWLGVL